MNEYINNKRRIAGQKFGREDGNGVWEREERKEIAINRRNKAL